MLRDRQEGMLLLHGCALTGGSVAVFLGWAALVEGIGMVRLSAAVNISLYTLGIVAAGLWIQHSLMAFRTRLGGLDWIESLRIALQQITRVTVVLLAIAFVTKDTGVSRAFLIGYVVVLTAFLATANMILPRLMVRLVFHRDVRRTVLVAPAGEVGELVSWVKARQQFGIQMVGWVSDREIRQSGPLPLLGRVDQLRRLVAEHDISQLLVSQSTLDPEQAQVISRDAEAMGCRVRFYANCRRNFGNLPIHVEHEQEYTFVIPASEPLDNPVNRAIKRALDIVISLPIVLLVLPPLALAVAAMQRVQSPGPLLHRQFRSGLNRRKFLIYKFRTMHVAAAAQTTAQAQRNDSRVYPFGRFLRRASLDEIPQFLNVLLGDMSVSGPRPHLLEHDEQFAKVVNAYYARHFVKPGITGLAQSKGFRGEISEVSLLHQRISYDMLYIRRWSLLLDLQILVDTVRQVFNPPRSAY